MLRTAGFAVTLGVAVVFGFEANAQISNNPYHVDYGWGQFQGRKIGVASGFKMDPDGKHLWMLDRCGANGCADSDLDPIIEVTLDGKFVKSNRDPAFQMSISSVVASTGTTIVGNGVHRNDGRWERTAFAAHAAEVEVDTVMGSVKVLNYVAVHDVGRVINGMGAEQQVEGGVAMSLGSTLYEELLTDQATGLPLNGNMLDYRVPSIKDVPEKIQVYFLDKPKEYGVFGAHGLGEPPMGPPGATIANAVHNAIGVWMDELPITRTRLAAALKQSA